MDKKITRIILFVILVVACLLRFYNFFNIPFTHDEFSALFRTQFNSFSGLISKGVIPDGHPAGLQVFLYYYTRMFGSEVWVVKLPFIIMGVVSVYFVYNIGRKWFDVSAGLICAAFVATLEFPVMYSQIARPYASGLLFCLLMVYFWHRTIFQSRRIFFFNLGFYVFFSVLCCYNHYFSLMFAVLVGITGLFYVKKDKMKFYILGGVVIALLFLPHLNITLQHLKMGGLAGWLAKPDIYFLFEHVAYIFHFSWWMFSVAILLISLGFYLKKNITGFFQNKFFIISVIWFLVPLLTGFIYSVLVSPVLQHSSLLFSFPFLLFVLFGHLGKVSPKLTATLVGVILIVSSLTLIFERNYYKLFYTSPYKEIAVETASFRQKHKSSEVVSIVDSNKKITRYYVEKENLDSGFYWYDSVADKRSLISFLDKQQAQCLTYGCISGNEAVVPFIVRDYYPYLLEQKNYFNGIFYVFGKNASSKQVSSGFSHNFGFEQNSSSWKINNPQHIDSFAHSGRYSYKIDASEEFGPTFEANTDSIVNHRNDYIDVSAWCYADGSTKGVKLVVTLTRGATIISWMAVDVDTYRFHDSPHWFKVYCSSKLSDVNIKLKNSVLKVYIWNPGKKSLFVDDIYVGQRPGNPLLYGLIKKIDL